MLGKRLALCTLVAAAALAATSARAADYTPPPPPPIYYQPPPVQECCSSWYLRGDVGVGMNGNYNIDFSPPINDGYFASNSIGDSFFIGGGLGYYVNSWLRFDATAEYRAKTNISALLTEQPSSPGPVAVDQYQGNLKSWIFLANAYVDLGTWNCFTPFVGAGVGGAYNMISDFTDVTPNVAAFGANGSSFGLGRGTNNWSLAWAVYAGVSYAVSKNLNIDLTYRYLNYGSAKETVDCNESSNCNQFVFKDLHSNDIMLGLRWTCCDTAPPAPHYVYQQPPVYQPPVYQPPPPVYQPPPPLRSRG